MVEKHPLNPPSAYTPLWCKSTYSFLEGASHPDELVEEAHRLGIQSLALTDRDGVYGIVRAHVKAAELGIHLIIGAEISTGNDSPILLLAMDRGGYANLCRLISKGRLRSPKGLSRVSWQEVCEHAGGLVAVWGGARSLLAAEQEPGQIASDIGDAFGDRLYALLTRHHEEDEKRQEHRLRERAKRYGIPLLAGMEVLYHTPARRDLQDVLTCIRRGVTLGAAGRLIKPNSEHALRTADGFARLFEDDARAVWQTNEIAERCTFSLNEIRYRYPSEQLPNGMDSVQWLHQLVTEGARTRYPDGVPAEVLRQIQKEMALVRQLDYAGYFLTMWEIVRYCRHKNILCQGRGSAANSVVCYCLGITAVDPVRMGLLFERFLSLERAEPPDIDLDIEHDRREEVIQHVYEKYGRTHAAMVANFIRYRARSALRDVGKVLGLRETMIERISQRLSYCQAPVADVFDQLGLDKQHPAHGHLVRLMGEIQEVPRHLSIHPGGFLLGHEPVHDLVPIENGTMADRTVIQWDKEDVEDLGLFKVDLLGLGALSVVHRACDLIEKHHGQSLSLATIPPADEPTYAMIRQADTVGVFQIESRAQMAMLPRLKPRNYYDLVVEVSLVRPGPITGGMVHPYLRRRNGEEPVTYPHALLEPVLKKTLGVPLFQEQVMRLAMVAADYTPGEADQLRRDMAAWRKTGRMERHRDRLISRMMEKGIAQEFAERIFEQLRGFGEYGFPESHAASFALIVYATAWLKRHYPAAYLCAMLNAQPMGFYSSATLVEDGKRHKLIIRPVDVQTSDWDCTLEKGERKEACAVRMGMRYVKGLSKAAGKRVVAARGNGPYRSVNDVASRARLDAASLTRLAEAGAFEVFGTERREALWQALGQDCGVRAQMDLETPEETTPFDVLDPIEELSWDYRATGHSPRGHPLARLREELTRRGLSDAATLRCARNGTSVRYAGYVICRQRPGTAGGVVFMTLEDETGFVNLVIWEKVFARYEQIAKTQPLLGVTGVMQIQDGVAHLIVKELWIPEITPDEHPIRSRDFH